MSAAQYWIGDELRAAEVRRNLINRLFERSASIERDTYIASWQIFEMIARIHQAQSRCSGSEGNPTQGGPKPFGEAVAEEVRNIKDRFNAPAAHEPVVDPSIRETVNGELDRVIDKYEKVKPFPNILGLT